MVVAVVAVAVVQPAGDQVVDVVAVGHRVVATALAVGMARVAVRRIGVPGGVLGVDRDHVLIDVALVRVVQMTFVQVVDVALVPDGGVTAARAVDVGMTAFVNGVSHGPRP